ncbi:hypothetical protein ACL02T_13165 [Pseudonocardia sp. RS010]|uniref:hypothetical protein n=1 Tax=Pseudonocardia sp. RS010 TaxID=3385979 RepID=UPI00399F5237
MTVARTPEAGIAATPSRARSTTSRLGPPLAVAIPTVLTGLHGLVYGRWIVDDAAITFAYARSIATGAGPVLQPGVDPVEGYSNPAWLALLVLGRWLGVFDHGAWFGIPDYVLFPKVLGLLCAAGVFACMYATARYVTRRPVLVTVIAGSATATVPSFVIWVVSGLENSLLALTATGIAAVLARAAAAGRLTTSRTATICGLLAALAALTRPDGLVYGAAFPLAVLVSARPQPARVVGRAVATSLGAFALPVAGYFAWRAATFGELLPNTALAKAQGLPGIESLARPGELVVHLGWSTVVIGALAVGAALARPSRLRDALIVWLVPLALAVVAYVVLEPDQMGQQRFASPVWPLFSFAVVLAGGSVAGLLARRGRALAAAVVVVGAASSCFGFVGQAREFRAAPTVPLCVVAANTGAGPNLYADLLHLDRATLVAPDMGGAGLVSRLRLVDLVGLTDAKMAALWAADDMAGLRDHVFDVVRPELLKTHGWWSTSTGLLADPRMAGYVKVEDVDPVSGLWVRADLVSPAQLQMLRDAAERTVMPRWAHYQKAAPLASCGDTLERGATAL